jgi:molybdopterin molybdotransferase
MSLLPVEEAQQRLLALAPALPIEQVPLLSAQGRFLAEPLIALRDQPWADLSAMDGYAIRHADLPGPWTVIGTSQTGAMPPATPVQPGEAMRIFTGAPLPPGADTIVVQEDAAVDGDRLTLTGDGPGTLGRHVRPRATDFAKAEALIPAGTLIGPTQIALAGVAGHATLPVHRRPRVAILSTGDELVPLGTVPPPGKLPSSNSVMLAAMLAPLGVEIIDLGLIPDDLAATTRAFEAARTADVIVSTGGASVGDHDLVQPGIIAAGGSIDFWRIALRPGKPLMAGRIGEAIVLGLPGNPVSAFVTAVLFLLPLVRKAMGSAEPFPARRLVKTNIALPAGGTRAEYVRARTVDGAIAALVDRDSAALKALAQADVLVERGIDAPAAAPGDFVPVIPIGAVGFAA